MRDLQMRKKLVLALIPIAIMAYLFWPSSNLKVEMDDEEEIIESNTRSTKTFSKLTTQSNEVIEKTEEVTTDTEAQNDVEFDNLQTQLKQNTQACRNSIDKLLPGEEKTEELPDDPKLLKEVLQTYVNSSYSQEVFNLNQALAIKTPSSGKIRKFIDNQEDNTQCYPFVEQEVLLKMLDDITDSEEKKENLEQYRDVIVDYLTTASNHPQSLFHLASYVNIVKVLSENQLVDSRHQYELERLRGDIMNTVKETDEELIKSLRGQDMSIFVDIHKKRFESSEKIKREFNQIMTEIKESKQ
jgi:hypothetical protein